MQIDVNNFSIAQVVPEIFAKTQVSKSARCVFLLLTVHNIEQNKAGFKLITMWLSAENLPTRPNGLVWYDVTEQKCFLLVRGDGLMLDGAAVSMSYF